MSFSFEGDSLTYNNNWPFTTKDRDNDDNALNCAAFFTGAWWHANCHIANLNGQYLNGAGSEFGKGVTWLTWLGQEYSLKFVEMKMRPKV